MCSAPADIFIWNVNPKCSVDNIIDDLKASNIHVTKNDITRMTRSLPADSNSRPPLDSYRITIQPEDYQKAMNPDVWPERVNVRPWLYKRSPHRDNSNSK